MKLKEFLEANKVIKESALAVLMWPDKNNQAKVFSNKINEKVTGLGNSVQRITENDEARAKVVLLELTERIKAYAGEPTAEPEATMKQEKQNVKEPTINKSTMIKDKEPTIWEKMDKLREQDKPKVKPR